MTDIYPPVSGLDAYTNADLEDIDKAAKVLGTIVAAFLGSSDDSEGAQPLHALYANTIPCRRVLERHNDLYEALKVAFEFRNFDALRSHGTTRILSARKLAEIGREAALQRQRGATEIEEILDLIREAIPDFVKQGGLKLWKAERKQVPDKAMRDHIEFLGIPSLRDAPGLLLHHLGGLTKDHTFASRLQNVFVKGKHTFLVNTSGSGKTRIAFEGLCQHWGFYLVGAVDVTGIGSPDLMNLLERPFPKSWPPTSSATEEMVRLTRQRLRQLLLSRLLVFSSFTDYVNANGMSSECKRLWLMIQALPVETISSWGDVFSHLVSWIVEMDEHRTQDHIAHLLSKLRSLFGADFHLFFVIDEAQATIWHHKSILKDENGDPYPILRDIIDCLGAEFEPYEVSFVAAGTEIPKSGFRNSSNTSLHRWCSDTGAFDDEDVHRRYVSHFLPPSYASTSAGRSLLKRSWHWCRGRYRFTDSLISTWMRDGFRSLHGLLDDYIETATGFRPTDNLEVENGERAEIRIGSMGCEIFDSPDFSFLTLHMQDVLFHYLVTGSHPIPFNADQIQIVNRAFGRFIDGDMSQIVIDEPIMLTAAAWWFFTNTADEDLSIEHRPLKESLRDILQQYPPSSLALACCLSFHITYAFGRGYPLSRVFSFSHSSPPHWANQKAEIVALHMDDPERYTSADAFLTVPLAFASVSLEGALSWLAQSGAPFCLYAAGNPDLIFVLRLADGTFIRVVLNATTTTSYLRGTDLRKRISRMRTEIFDIQESDSELHRRVNSSLEALPPRSKIHKHPSVLRVIASSPHATWLKTATKKGTEDVAGLNNKFFQTLSAEIAASTILRQIIETVTVGKRIFPEPVANTAERRGASASSPPNKRART